MLKACSLFNVAEQTVREIHHYCSGKATIIEVYFGENYSKKLNFKNI